MNRIGTITVIHKDGDTIIYNNGYTDDFAKRLVADEIKRHQAQYKKQQEWNEMKIKNRDARLAVHLDRIYNITPPKPISKRIADGVCDSIGFIYACFVVWVEQLGLI